METRIPKWPRAIARAAFALAGIAAGIAALTPLLDMAEDSAGPGVMIAVIAALIFFGQLHYVLIGWISPIPRDQRAFNWASLIPNIAVSLLFILWALTYAGSQVTNAIATAYDLSPNTKSLVPLSLAHLVTAGLWLAVYLRAITPTEQTVRVSRPKPGLLKKMQDLIRRAALEEKTEEELPPKKRIWVPGDDDQHRHSP